MGHLKKRASTSKIQKYYRPSSQKKAQLKKGKLILDKIKYV